MGNGFLRFPLDNVIKYGSLKGVSSVSSISTESKIWLILRTVGFRMLSILALLEFEII